MKNELKYPPTPILILYLNISPWTNNVELDETIEAMMQKLGSYREHGWESIIIPIRDSETRIEVAAIDGSFDVIEFDKLKEQILAKCGN